MREKSVRFQGIKKAQKRNVNDVTTICPIDVKFCMVYVGLKGFPMKASLSFLAKILKLGQLVMSF